MNAENADFVILLRRSSALVRVPYVPYYVGVMMFYDSGQSSPNHEVYRTIP
ncbi:MAG: hypothetical protein RL275_2190 [Chloroflexota bacterium]|jgi:succinate dehydrogenase hydrophobic anchor subunit